MSAYFHIAEPRPLTRWGRVDLAPRRSPFGIFGSSAEELGQPQDGASSDAAVAVAAVSSPTARSLHEPEDARLTGGTRSLMRRVLGLNVTNPATKPVRSLRLRKPGLQQLPAA